MKLKWAGIFHCFTKKKKAMVLNPRWTACKKRQRRKTFLQLKLKFLFSDFASNSWRVSEFNGLSWQGKLVRARGGRLCWERGTVPSLVLLN